ncbi:iron ABC transporter permease [Tissierella praeacuta]|uniref:FecCD family ABC transporter permease n=1 Tax=Tissierella praeacuta TaxID=43131 RepID=UPI00334138F8
MKQKDEGKYSVQTVKKGHLWNGYLVIIIGLVLLALMMVFSLTKGGTEIPLKIVWNALFHFDIENIQHLVVIDLRLPRIIASSLVGAAFAVAGAVMQGITRNPMADSGLMGLNSGAVFALSICFSFFPSMNYGQIVLFSFLGASIGAGLVQGIAFIGGGRDTHIRLILAGVAVSSLFSSLGQGIALYFNVSQNIMFWTVGGVASSNWEQIKIMTPWIIGALTGAIVLSRWISILSLGEDVAKGLGLNVAVIYGLCTIVILILAGISVSVVGAVGFVGIIIPHASRFLVGMDYRLVIPSSAVLGSLLMVVADIGARMINPPFETPIGVLTALVGVPFFLYLSRKQRRTL